MTSNISEKSSKSAGNIYNIVTLRDVENVVDKIFNNPTIKILDYNIEKLTEKTLGLLGCHQELIITLQKKDQSEPETLNLFVKSIPYHIEQQAEFIMNQGIFAKESNIFNMVVPLLKENYKGVKWSPTCYLATKDVLIMENLKPQGYKIRGPFFDSTKLLKSALATLAQLHACSILVESRDSKHQVKLNELYPESFKEIMFSRKGRVLDWFATNVNIVARVADHLGYDSKKISKIFDKVYEIVKPSSRHCNVVTHADLWTNNLMFDDSEPIPKCVLVDFQLVRYAPLVLDILQLLYLNATRDYRNKSEKELIKFYQSVLEETIKDNDTRKNVKILTVEEILKEYEELRVYGVIIALLYYPSMLMGSKFYSECGKDSKSFEEFISGDRVELTLNCMESDPFFKSTFEDEVNELAEIAKHC